MVQTLERRERAHNKLTFLPDGDKFTAKGGIAELTGELTAEFSLLYLNEINSVTFIRKLAVQDFNTEDLGHVAEFLREHNVRPTARNCFRLILGARLRLALEDRR